MINIEIKREPAESTTSALRRFSRKMNASGIVKKVKALKARERRLSFYKRKASALKRLARSAEYERLKKLGKIEVRPQRP